MVTMLKGTVCPTTATVKEERALYRIVRLAQFLTRSWDIAQTLRIQWAADYYSRNKDFKKEALFY